MDWISTKEKIDKYLKQIEITSWIDRTHKIIRIYCPNTGFRIEIENYKDIKKNKELALLMYTLYLE